MCFVELFQPQDHPLTTIKEFVYHKVRHYTPVSRQLHSTNRSTSPTYGSVHVADGVQLLIWLWYGRPSTPIWMQTLRGGHYCLAGKYAPSACHYEAPFKCRHCGRFKQPIHSREPQSNLLQSNHAQQAIRPTHLQVLSYRYIKA